MDNIDLKDVIARIELFLSKSEAYGKVKVTIEEVDDDYALLEVQGHQVCIELRAEDEVVGIAKRTVKRIYYYPSYYAEEGGSYWEPADVVEHELNKCSSLVEACVELHALQYRYMLECMDEARSFSDEYDTILDNDRMVG